MPRMKVARLDKKARTLRCPHCGMPGPFRYLEEITSFRQVRDIGADGILRIDGYYEVFDDDGGHPRLLCMAPLFPERPDGPECLGESRIPRGLEIDFV